MSNKFFLVVLLFLCASSLRAAMQFTAASTNYAYIAVSDGQAINISSSTWSASFWFLAQATNTYTAIATENFWGEFNTGTTNPLIEMDLSAVTGNIRTVIRDDAGNIAIASVNGTNYHLDGQWHQAVGIHISTAVYLYIDGVFSSSAAIAGYGVTSVNTFDIGSLKRGVQQNTFQGKIDDFALYNRALSVTEIATLYSSRSRNRFTDGRVGYWPLDNGPDGLIQSGTGPVYDRSGNGFNLTTSNNAGDPTINPVWKASTWINYP